MQSQLPPCVIETDSLMMKQILNYMWKPPWNIVVHVEEIKHLMSMCIIPVTHVLREGNKLAAHLANITLDQ